MYLCLLATKPATAHFKQLWKNLQLTKEVQFILQLPASMFGAYAYAMLGLL